MQIQDLEERSLESRKQLGTQTKLFKGLTGEEKMNKFGALLKLYQKEIDSLTKRSKFSESSYSMLAEVAAQSKQGLEDEIQRLRKAFASEKNKRPEPLSGEAKTAMLDPLKRKITALEVENKSLVNEIKDIEAELMTLKNQDITIRELEEKLDTFQNNVSVDIEAQVETRQLELENMFEREREDMRDKLVEASSQVRAARAEEDKARGELDKIQSELFALRSRVDEEMESHQKDLIAMSEEAERANAKVAILEDKLAQEKTDEPNFTSDALASQLRLQNELMEKENLIEQLNKSLVLLKAGDEMMTTSDEPMIENNHHLDSAHHMSSGKLSNSGELEMLKAMLDARPTVDEFSEVTSKLHTLEMLLFNVVDDEAGMESTVTSSDKSKATDSSSCTENSLERMLVKKIHRMEADTTKYKIKYEETSELLEAQRKMHATVEAQVREHKALIDRLENDLAQQQCGLSGFSRASLERAGLNQILGGDASASLLQKLVLESPAVAEFAQPVKPVLNSNQQASSMEDILRGQRDRYRKRVIDLEAKASQDSVNLNEAIMNADQLRKDNIKLYEKIRYLQTYQGYPDRRNKSSNSRVRSSHPNQLSDGIDGVEKGYGLEGKYRDLYEETVNPFAQFNKHERDKRIDKISAMDKMILMGGKFFMRNRYSRGFLFFYMLFLHVMLFLTMYNFTHAHHMFHIVRTAPKPFTPHAHEMIVHK